jgi:hypothetical protein
MQWSFHSPTFSQTSSLLALEWVCRRWYRVSPVACCLLLLASCFGENPASDVFLNTSRDQFHTEVKLLRFITYQNTKTFRVNAMLLSKLHTFQITITIQYFRTLYWMNNVVRYDCHVVPFKTVHDCSRPYPYLLNIHDYTSISFDTLGILSL